MEVVDLRNQEGVSNLISIGKFVVSDSTAEDVYQELKEEEGYTEQQTTALLSRPIIWRTDDEGNVELYFKVNDTLTAEKYRSENLSNETALLGAIYTFYNQNLTSAVIDKISDTDEDKRRISNIVKRRKFKKISELLADHQLIGINLSLDDESYEILVGND